MFATFLAKMQSRHPKLSFKVATYNNFNGGLVTKHGVAKHAWIAIL